MINLKLKDDKYPFVKITKERNIVRAIIYDDEGNFYFTKLKRDDIFDKLIYIETSGGGVEVNEDLVSALKRELKEELGAEVEIICKMGVVDDYYNLINTHNLNNYYLCKLLSFDYAKDLTKLEKRFDLSLIKLKYDEAIKEYERMLEYKLGSLVAKRELPILKEAKRILDEKDFDY